MAPSFSCLTCEARCSSALGKTIGELTSLNTDIWNGDDLPKPACCDRAQSKQSSGSLSLAVDHLAVGRYVDSKMNRIAADHACVAH